MWNKRLLGQGTRQKESRETGKSAISPAARPPAEGNRDAGVTQESWHWACQVRGLSVPQLPFVWF